MTIGDFLLYLYLIGIIGCTIGFGVGLSLSSMVLKDDEAIWVFFFIITWPVWLFIALFILAVFLFVYNPIMFLMFKSRDCCDGIVNWWKSKKKPSNDNKVV